MEPRDHLFKLGFPGQKTTGCLFMLSKPFNLAVFTTGLILFTPSETLSDNEEPLLFPIHVVHLKLNTEEEIIPQVDHHFLLPKNMGIQILCGKSVYEKNKVTITDCKPFQSGNTGCILTSQLISHPFTEDIQDIQYQEAGSQTPRPFPIIFITSYTDVPSDHNQIARVARKYLDVPITVDDTARFSIWHQWFYPMGVSLINWALPESKKLSPSPQNRCRYNYRCREYRGSFSKNEIKKTINPNFGTIALENLAFFEQELNYFCQRVTIKANNQQHPHDET